MIRIRFTGPDPVMIDLRRHDVDDPRLRSLVEPGDVLEVSMAQAYGTPGEPELDDEGNPVLDPDTAEPVITSRYGGLLDQPQWELADNRPLTVDEVLDQVAGDPGRAAAALADEMQRGKPRKSLVEQLEELAGEHPADEADNPGGDR